MNKLSKRTWAKLEAEGANTAQPPKVDLSAMSPHQRDAYARLEAQQQRLAVWRDENSEWVSGHVDKE